MTQTPADIARCGHIIVFLREQLERRGWTVRDLSLALALAPESTTAYAWLRGTSAPGPTLRNKLSALFNVSPEMFLPKARDERVPPAEAPVKISRTLPAASARHEVLSFTVGSDGNARIRLDATMPLASATPLLRMLLDAGLAFSPVEPEAVSA
jgi:transcriptional regulator with XRE-family HTH domain